MTIEQRALATCDRVCLAAVQCMLAGLGSSRDTYLASSAPRPASAKIGTGDQLSSRDQPEPARGRPPRGKHASDDRSSHIAGGQGACQTLTAGTKKRALLEANSHRRPFTRKTSRVWRGFSVTLKGVKNTMCTNPLRSGSDSVNREVLRRGSASAITRDGI